MIKKALTIFGVLILTLIMVQSSFASQTEGTINTGLDTGPTGNIASAPTASPAAGTYTATQTVTLTASGATTICYTINGADASCDSSVACSAGSTAYTGAITVSSNTTIKTVACYPQNTPSNSASYAYVISAPSGSGGYSPVTTTTTTTTTVPTTTTTTTTKPPVWSTCQWCGLACIKLESWMYCPALTPAAGYICTEVDGVCTKTIGTTTTTVPSEDGTVSSLQARIAQLQEMLNNLLRQLGLSVVTTTTLPGTTITPSVTVTGIPEGFTFKNNLSQGMVSEDVRYLQIFLNSHSGTQVASSGLGSSGQETNYFGDLTKAAVIKFQDMYASEILAQWGLTKGNGYVGQSTRSKLNELLK